MYIAELDSSVVLSCQKTNKEYQYKVEIMERLAGN